MLSTTLEDLEVYLTEDPHETCKRFQEILIDAQNVYNIEQVQCLVKIKIPTIDNDTCLQQWRTYALGYLALVADHQPDIAAECLESLRSEKESLSRELLGRVLNGLGNIYDTNHQLDRAAQCYQECIEFYEITKNPLRLGMAHYNIAIVHQKSRDYEAALTSIERSIKLLDRHPDDHSWLAQLGNAQNELGLTLMDLKHFEEAREALELSLTIDQQCKNRLGEGISNNNLGHLFRRLGELKTAQEYYKKGKDICFEVDSKFDASESLFYLGVVCLLQSKDDSTLSIARDYFEQALDLAYKSNNNNLIPEILLSRADLAEGYGNQDTALKENKDAINAIESLRANIIMPEYRAELQGAWIKAYEKIIGRLNKDSSNFSLAEAYYYAERAKSRGLIEILKGRPIRPPTNIPTEWFDQEITLRQTLLQLYDDPDSNRDQIDSYEEELGELRRRIRIRDAEFDSFHTVAPLTLDDVMNRLPKGAVLLEYFTVEDAILAFIITAEDAEVKTLPLKLSTLEGYTQSKGAKPSRLLKQLTRGNNYELTPQPWYLEKLYDALIAPLSKKITTASSLYIVPHGPLHYVPFHSLYQKTPDGPKYLVTNGTQPRQIIYAPSATTLFDYCQSKPPSAQMGCLAFGFNDPSVNLSQAELGAKAIAELMGGKSQVAKDATKKLLFEEGSNYQYLHFSCHGTFNPKWPLSSWLRLADGTLDVADILHYLRLDADLVSLSACETGRSHILQGDELIGLVRAFLYAGTPSVLVSHWVVDELSTRLLMDYFYQELKNSSDQAKPMSKAEALSLAQIYIKNITVDELREKLKETESNPETIDQQLQYLAITGGLIKSNEKLQGNECLLAHPYYWAPFFLVGDRIEV